MRLTKSEWIDLPPQELDGLITKVFDYYRSVGFPFFPTDTEYRKREYTKLHNYDFSRKLDIENKLISQSMHGLALAWSYMPHSWEVRCNSKMTPKEAFNDDDIFRRVIRKRFRMGDNISDNGIRKMIKIFTGVQSVSNFRPTAAAAIYKQFSPVGGTVWDMSAGFGGRMLGADLANVHYIGTDPATKTFEGLTTMRDDFSIDAQLYKIGSEDFIPDANSLDLCFTSPPYFDTEKYSDEATQSYVKYPDTTSWIDGYLKSTMNNCRTGLKVGSFMIINIAKVKSFPTIEQDVIKTAEDLGFVLCDQWGLLLSNLAGGGYKSEPLFVFKKR